MSDEKNTYGLIVVGSGAAGLAAAVYAGRYLIRTLVIGKEFGGQTAWGGQIENYPGIHSIDGYELMKQMKEHAVGLGAEFADGTVSEITKDGDCFTVKTEGGETYSAGTVILATGAERRRLGLDREEELTGKGLHYCVTCDAPLYRDKTIAIVGGGDASVKGANLAAQYVSKIYLIMRDKDVMAEPVNLSEMQKLGDKVELVPETEVAEILGTDKVEGVKLTKELNGSTDLTIDGLFIEIGAIPDVGLAEQLGAELDEHRHITTDNMMQTNVPGVMAAGDVVNLFGRFKQDITAAAMGAVAATSAYNYLKQTGTACGSHAKPQAVSKVE